MRLAQCGSMEAKALSFVLRAAGSEHHMSSTRRMFTYVVGGRVGMNDTCYFTLDMKKLDPTPPHPTVLSVLKSVLLLTCTLSSPPHPTPPFCPKYPQVCLALDLYVIIPTPPFCLKYPQVCLAPDLYVIIPTPPHPFV